MPKEFPADRGAFRYTLACQQTGYRRRGLGTHPQPDRRIYSRRNAPHGHSMKALPDPKSHRTTKLSTNVDQQNNEAGIKTECYV
jgi:hypothetical protein